MNLSVASFAVQGVRKREFNSKYSEMPFEFSLKFSNLDRYLTLTQAECSREVRENRTQFPLL